MDVTRGKLVLEGAHPCNGTGLSNEGTAHYEELYCDACSKAM